MSWWDIALQFKNISSTPVARITFWHFLGGVAFIKLLMYMTIRCAVMRNSCCAISMLSCQRRCSLNYIDSMKSLHTIELIECGLFSYFLASFGRLNSKQIQSKYYNKILSLLLTFNQRLSHRSLHENCAFPSDFTISLHRKPF